MRIVSWNVNGLRACARKAFPQFLRESAADVIGVQEVRALPEQLDAETRAPPGWHACFAPGGPGYSGVAIYSRAEPDEVLVGVGERRFDVEGRLITARFGRTFVVNGYFPKGSGSKRDNSRVPPSTRCPSSYWESMPGRRSPDSQSLPACHCRSECCSGPCCSPIAWCRLAADRAS